MKTNGTEQKPRNKPTHLQPTDFWQMNKEHTIGKGKSLQQMLLEKLSIHMRIYMEFYLSTNYMYQLKNR
jgi:hypothetical protein